MDCFLALIGQQWSTCSAPPRRPTGVRALSSSLSWEVYGIYPFCSWMLFLCRMMPTFTMAFWGLRPVKCYIWALIFCSRRVSGGVMKWIGQQIHRQSLENVLSRWSLLLLRLHGLPLLPLPRTLLNTGYLCSLPSLTSVQIVTSPRY